MKQNKKIFILLIVLLISLQISCAKKENSSDISIINTEQNNTEDGTKENNENSDNNENEIKNTVEGENDELENIKEALLVLLQSSDSTYDSSIKDIIKIDDYLYFVYEPTSTTQVLYTTNEKKELIPLLENKDVINLYKSDSHIYVYYEDNASDYKKNVDYLKDFENNKLEVCYTFNNGELMFSKNYNYFAIINRYRIVIFDKNRLVFDENITNYIPEDEVEEFTKLYDNYEFNFSDEEDTLLVNYTLENDKVYKAEISLSNLEVQMQFQ